MKATLEPERAIQTPEESTAVKAGLAHRAFVGVLKTLPKGLVRLASSQYIAGEKLSDGLRVADRLWKEKNFHSTLDLLGEDVESTEQIEVATREMHGLIDELEKRPHANLSLKLSALGQAIDADDCLRRARELVEHARQVDSFVRLDMEDQTTIDSTLHIYRELRRDFDNCGIVLQSRMFRTREDIQALAELKPNVRLCIGIYNEPAAIALTDKRAMKTHMLELLGEMWSNGQHVGLATHEEWVIREALRMAEERKKPASELEVQMLLGVPRAALLDELVQRGIRVRLYVPYGQQWHAYSMRRLEYNPDMLKMVAMNVLGGIFRRR